MSTQLREEGAEAPQERIAGDYFVVGGEFCTWYVSTPIARFIEECLDNGSCEWVKFVDLVGARVRLRTRQIEFITQCTAEQRSAEREFFRALKRERQASKDWDE